MPSCSTATPPSLTVIEVANSHLPGAALAHLSACDTTRGATPRPPRRGDPLHLRSPAGGTPDVIGTRWPVNDQAARRIADAFHATPTLDGTALPHPEQGPSPRCVEVVLALPRVCPDHRLPDPLTLTLRRRGWRWDCRRGSGRC
ncbi:CHAT domain-containing protein [Streptomyces sp. NBC_01803]|uniref:CHAT domain-containing protein n=1 Tax=Streptomyces sp. NBC_01803 TaxID=2975946 RepID=UPI003FA34D5D